MTSSLFVDVRAALNGKPYTPAGYFYAVDGTAYPGCPFPPHPILDDGNGWWSGFSSGMVGGLANTQDGLWKSTCIGYSAATIPMWPSVQQGRSYLVGAILYDSEIYEVVNGTLDGLVICGTGYSQGAMVWDQVYVLDFLSPTGVLHHLLPYLYRIYQYGHIFRTPGIAHGNALAGLPESIKQDGVETGGIGGPLDLTVDQTNRLSPDGKPTVYSCANHGDLYACCSVGTNPWTHLAPEGQIADLFYKVVMQPTLAGFLSMVKVLGHPIAGVEELFHVMGFFGAGTNSPHFLYFPQMDACIGDMLSLGNSLPHMAGV
jgi:hypothetical protein